MSTGDERTLTRARETFFPDDDLIRHVREFYGWEMAQRVSDLFAADLDNETGFVRSVRRSLTYDIERKIAQAKPAPYSGASPGEAA